MGDPIPFANFQAAGLEELGGASPIAMNVIIEPPAPSGKQGVVRRRPGIQAWPLATPAVIDPNGLCGVFATSDGAIWAVGAVGPERPIYSVTAAGALLLGGGISPHGLRGSARPIFVETAMLVVIAGGELIQKVERATLLSDRLGGLPPLATHIVANSSRLLANDPTVDSSKIRYSDVAQGNVTYAGNETWSSIGPGPGGTVPGFFSAEAKPDPIVAVYEDTNEIFIWGAQTLQVFGVDGTLVYAPTATREYGCAAPYSIIKDDNQFYWLDHQRRFVKSDGRSFTELSESIQRIIDDMDDVSDCFGYRVLLGPFSCMVWTFPSDGRTFCYQEGAGWGQWQGWNGNWTPFGVTAYWLKDSTSDSIVTTVDGRVGELALEATTDLGAPINAYVMTGYQNRGTDARKHCARVDIVLRRGNATTPGPQGWLYWRDRPGDWTGKIPIDFGDAGDTDPVLHFHSLGEYRRRQWAFEFSAGSDLSLVAATEEYEVLDF